MHMCILQLLNGYIYSSRQQSSFTSAMCYAMIEYTDCEMASTYYPYIQRVLESLHAKFDEDFWNLNCASLFDNETTTDVDVPGMSCFCYYVTDLKGQILRYSVRLHRQLNDPIVLLFSS